MDRDSEAFRVTIRLPRILDRVRDLLGPHVYLWQAHMNHKVAGRGEAWQWHQDYNNFSMAIELKVMKVATEKYRSTDISGHYADFARALGGWGERVTEPGEIVPSIKRGVERTREGTPALLEFITEKATDFSIFS